MKEITCEIRFAEDESRSSPGRLRGTLLKYGALASDRNETFLHGSLSWAPEGVLLREMHRRDSPIARVLPVEIDGEIRIDAQLPNTQRGRDAAENIRQGVYGGRSVEFQAVEQRRAGGRREIVKGVLGGCGLVDLPSYEDSKVEVRAKTDIRKRQALIWL